MSGGAPECVWRAPLEREAARGFAEHHRPYGGVVLQTLVPPDAALLVHEDEGYYDEGEIVVDPFRLAGVTVVERLPMSPKL